MFCTFGLLSCENNHEEKKKKTTAINREKLQTHRVPANGCDLCVKQVVFIVNKMVDICRVVKPRNVQSIRLITFNTHDGFEMSST